MSSPTTEVPKPETRPKLPEGWRWVRLKDVASLSGDPFNPRVFPEEVFAHYSIPAFDNNKSPVFEKGALILSQKTLISNGVVLFSKLNPRISRVWFVDGEFSCRKICSTEFLPIAPRAEILDAKFLVFLLQVPTWIGTLRNRARAATKSRERLKPDDVMSSFIPLPPLETQRRIAAILTEQMEAVKKARKAAEEGLEAARKLPEACLRSAFPTVPITVNTAPAPKGWRWTLLTDFARLESGHTPSRRREEWWGGDIPWISLSDIRALDGKTAIQTREYTNPEGIANSSARVLPAGTVVLSRTASVGFVTVMGRPMATSQDFVNWVCGPELEPWYLAYALMASREYIRSLGSGAVHQTVYVPVVQRFRLLHPDLEMQRRIIATLNDQLAHTKHLVCGLEAQLEAIRALPAAILRRAFSGEL